MSELNFSPVVLACLYLPIICIISIKIILKVTMLFNISICFPFPLLFILTPIIQYHISVKQLKLLGFDLTMDTLLFSYTLLVS